MRSGRLLCLATLVVSAWSSPGFADDAQVFEIDTSQVIEIEAERPIAEPGQVRIDADEAEQIAGVQGDALKALATVGGVTRLVGSSQGISVWGAAPSETQIYVDDIPVPRLFHFGGTRSILPSSEISQFELLSGGAPARFGRGIGGAVSIRTARVGPEPASMRFRMDPIDVGGQLSTRFGDRGSFSFASRSSVLAPSFEALAQARAEEAIAIPDYWDYQSRFSYRLGDGQELDVLGLLSGDELERGIPSLTADERFRERSSTGFSRLGVTLRKVRGQDSRRLTVWVGREDDETDLDYGDVFARQRRQTSTLGLLLVQERRLRRDLKLRFGVDSQLSRSRWSQAGAVTLPAREGDIGVFGQAPGDRVNEDEWTVTQAGVGLFATASYRTPGGVVVEPGLRVEPGVVNGDRVLPARPSEPEVGYTELQWALDPRGKISYQITENWGVYVAGGRYHQAPSAGDLSPVFGSPVLEPSSAWQGLLGTQVQALPWLQLEVQGFTSRQRKLATRSPSATPVIANLLESTGQGRVVGSQLSARADLASDMRASMSYTLMKAERRNAVGPWRLFDQDVRHTLRSAWQWSNTSGFSLGARLEVTSGFPRTPVLDAVFNAASQSYDPVFGAQNSVRLPLFAELSLRAGYEGGASWGTYRLWLDVVNASNRSNVQERYYSADFMQEGFVRGLPVLPLLGAELRI